VTVRDEALIYLISAPPSNFQYLNQFI